MKYLVAQNTHPKFKWEIDVLLTNLYSLDPKLEVVVLFAVDKPDDPVVDYIVRRWGDRAEIHAYMDTRRERMYVASTRPFLWYCYLSEDPTREQDTYFQIDTDIIFRRLPDWSKVELSESVWAGSDCASYINADYIKGCSNGDEVLDNFARLIKVDRSVLERLDGAGAQWVLVKPTAEYWLKVQSDCHKLSGYLDLTDSDIQKWCAEMWAQLFNAPLFGAEYKITPELDFCWAGDKIGRWHATTLLHNTGLSTSDNKDRAFDKTKYDDLPYDLDFSWVGEDLCSIEYVKALKKVVKE